MSGRGGVGIKGALGDVSFALRTLVRRPALAVGVVLTLGLGVGATTATYSVVDAVLLRPLDYEDPERLVAFGTTFPGREWDDQEAGLQHLAGMSYLNFADFRERARSFEALGGAESVGVLLPDQGDGTELVTAARATDGFWTALRVAPVLGRLFGPEDYEVGTGADPILLSHAAWTRRFGADPGVLGRPLGSVGGPSVVVGVLPADFEPPETLFGHAPELWLPLQGGHDRYTDRGGRSMVLVGRLAAGVTVEVARAEVDAIADRLADEYPDGNVYPDGSSFGAGVNGLQEQTVGGAANTLLVFLGAAVLLLMIAVLNATTLLLARSMERSHELAVRVALGAGRWRVVRLVLGESVVLAVGGGLVGAGLGWGGVWAFHRFGPSSVPRMAEVTLDLRVLLVTMGLAIASGLVAGTAPALRAVRRPPGGLSSRSEDRSASRLRSALVTVQLGLAVLLLSGAGLLFHSFLELRSVEPGFDAEGLVSFQVAIKRPGAAADEEPWQAWDELLELVGASAGVQAVAASTNPPFQDPYWAPRVLLPDDPPDARGDGVAGYAVTPGYFDLLGTPIRRGRDFTRGDGVDGPFVAIVNEAWVRSKLGPDGDALSTSVRMTGLASAELRTVHIVGVVGDVIQRRAEDGARPAIYVPYTQQPWFLIQPVVRSDLPLEILAPELRRAVARFSPAVPTQAMGTLGDRMAATRTDPRFKALLFTTFASVALLLAGAGLYASLAHSVSLRRRELGVRMALGARRSGVRALVVMQALRSAVVGIALGLVGALALSRTLTRFLFQVEPADPVSLLGAAALLGMMAMAASYIPARRATSVDPAEVLRSE